MEYTVDWFPYPETSPEDGVEVLAYSKVHGVVVTIPEHFGILRVTHWTWLPKNKPDDAE